MTKNDILEVLDMCKDSLNEFDEMILLYTMHANPKLRAKTCVRIDRFIDLATERFELTTELINGVTKGDGAISLMNEYNRQFNALITLWRRTK